MRRFLKPAMEGLVQSQPGELFPGNKLPFPSSKPGQLAAVMIHTTPDDPFNLGMTEAFHVISPEDAEKKADYINVMYIVNNAMASVTALEELAEVAEQSLPAGLDEPALAIMEVASQYLLADVGVEAEPVTALESLQKDRPGHTRAVVESLRTHASTIRKRVTAAVQRMTAK